MEQTATTEEQPLPFGVGFELNPSYTARGQLTGGVKVWMSAHFDSPEQCRAWLKEELRRCMAAVKQCMAAFELKQGGEE